MFMNNTSLNLVSFNIKGLGENHNFVKYNGIERWMASLANPPQILLLQKDHLDAISCNGHIKYIKLWKGETLWNPSIPMGRSKRRSA